MLLEDSLLLEVICVIVIVLCRSQLLFTESLLNGGYCRIMKFEMGDVGLQVCAGLGDCLGTLSSSRLYQN